MTPHALRLNSSYNSEIISFIGELGTSAIQPFLKICLVTKIDNIKPYEDEDEDDELDEDGDIDMDHKKKDLTEAVTALLVQKKAHHVKLKCAEKALKGERGLPQSVRSEDLLFGIIKSSASI